MALLMIIPAILLGLQKSQELRSKAALTINCTTSCLGTVSVSPFNSNQYVFREESSGQGLLLKSLGSTIGFKSYVGKRVAVKGNIINEPLPYQYALYVASISLATPILTPIIRPLYYNCLQNIDGQSDCILGTTQGYSTYNSCMSNCPTPE